MEFGCWPVFLKKRRTNDYNPIVGFRNAPIDRFRQTIPDPKRRLVIPQRDAQSPQGLDKWPNKGVLVLPSVGDKCVPMVVSSFSHRSNQANRRPTEGVLNGPSIDRVDLPRSELDVLLCSVALATPKPGQVTDYIFPRREVPVRFSAGGFRTKGCPDHSFQFAWRCPFSNLPVVVVAGGSFATPEPHIRVSIVARYPFPVSQKPLGLIHVRCIEFRPKGGADCPLAAHDQRHPPVTGLSGKLKWQAWAIRMPRTTNRERLVTPNQGAPAETGYHAAIPMVERKWVLAHHRFLVKLRS